MEAQDLPIEPRAGEEVARGPTRTRLGSKGGHRGERVNEASHAGPELSNIMPEMLGAMAFECSTNNHSAMLIMEIGTRVWHTSIVSVNGYYDSCTTGYKIGTF